MAGFIENIMNYDTKLDQRLEHIHELELGNAFFYTLQENQAEAILELKLRHLAKLEEMKIPFGPLAKPGDLFDDKQLNHDGRMLDIHLPTGKHAKLPGLPLEMGGRKTRVRRQPPVMGGDTRAVLKEAGYLEGEIHELVAQGVVITESSAKQPAKGKSS